MTIIIIFAIYMIAMMVVGQIGKKYSGTLSDSLTAGKQGTLIMVAGSFLGSHIGTGIVVGGATNGATYGVGAGWYGVGAALSFALFAFVTARWVRKHGYVTISTYFRDCRSGHCWQAALCLCRYRSTHRQHNCGCGYWHLLHCCWPVGSDDDRRLAGYYHCDWHGCCYHLPVFEF